MRKQRSLLHQFVRDCVCFLIKRQRHKQYLLHNDPEEYFRLYPNRTHLNSL